MLVVANKIKIKSGTLFIFNNTLNPKIACGFYLACRQKSNLTCFLQCNRFAVLSSISFDVREFFAQISYWRGELIEINYKRQSCINYQVCVLTILRFI